MQSKTDLVNCQKVFRTKNARDKAKKICFYFGHFL